MRGHYEERSPKLGFESWPKFPGNPGIEIFSGNPVLSCLLIANGTLQYLEGESVQ